MNSNNSNDQSHSSPEPREEDPGAYPIPFSTGDVELGRRLDSISASLRYWAVDKKRAQRRWYNDMVQANNRYEEWLSTQSPGEYPVPFRPGQRMDEIDDGLRYWAVHPDRSSTGWYDFFVRANARYEQYLTATREFGKFPFPWGKHAGVAIKNVPQDVVWSALRPSNHHQGWYEALYEANKRFLDDVYSSRSPGSEPIWFGKRYRGLPLYQVYQRKGFLDWCFDPQRKESGWICRLRDLVRRHEAWRRAHPERSGPRRRRRAPDIQNPVGEAIRPWDDSSGSAAEDEEYERDNFVVSDDEAEFGEEDLSDSSETPPDQSGSDNDDTWDSNDSSGSCVDVTHAVRQTHKRRRTNIIVSDGEEVEEVGPSARKLGKKYRLQRESSEE